MLMMPSSITIKEYAAAVGITERAAQLQARNGKTAHVRNGRQILIVVDELPDDVRQAIMGKEEIDALSPVPSTSPTMPVKINGDQQISSAKQGKAMMKISLLRLYMEALAGAGWGKKGEARKLFMEAYNSGVDYQDIHAVLGRLSWKTIEGWKALLKRHNGNSLALADRRGCHLKGKRSVDPLQARILIAVVRQPKGRRAKSDIIIEAKARMAQKGLDIRVSDATFRRFLDDWISTHYDEWIFWREGEKGLVDKCLFWVERDYDRIEVGDILVADGHVLNFTVINPWSGKPKRMMLVLFFDMKSSMPLGWEIMPTENTQAISVALRRAILRLGKIPKIVYLDNGRAFKGQYFTGVDFDQTELPGLYQQLGINLIVAKPYHGQSKTIERFFKTFAKLEEQSPSYCGTSIELKPPHLSRGEKMHTRVHDKITNGATPTIEQAHQAIALWFDWYAAQPQSDNSHLAGQRPQDLFEAGRGPGVDPLALRHLMMKKEVKTIHRRGIKHRGEWYYDPALYGRKHKVYIRYDLQEQDSLLVYDARTDEEICEAFQPGKVHPAARVLGDDRDKEELERQLEMQAGLKKQTMSYATSFVDAEVVPGVQKQIEAAGFALPAPNDKIKRLPARPSKPTQLTEADEAAIMAEVEEIEAYHAENKAMEIEEDTFVRQVVDKETELAERLAALAGGDLYEELIILGIHSDLSAEHLTFMRYFEKSTEYEQHRDYYEACRTKAALMYQAEEK